jgi:hypothetical protein
MEALFSRDSSLPDLSQRATRIRAGLGYSRVLRHVLLVIATATLAVTVFGIPVRLTALFAGAELALAALAGLMEVARKRAVTEIAMSTGREGYQRILRASAYYDRVRSIYGLAVALAILLGAQFYCPEDLSASIGGAAVAAVPALASIPVSDLLIMLAAFHVLLLASRWLRYRGIRSLPETTDYAELNRRYLLFARRERLLQVVPFAGVVVLALGLWHGIVGVPWEVPLVAACVSPVPFLIGARNPRHLNGPPSEPEPRHPVIHRSHLESRDEAVSGAVFGIQKISDGPPDAGSPGRSSRADLKKNPENSLVMTNRRLLFIHVPVTAGPAAGKKGDTLRTDCFSHLPEIRKKGSGMLKARSLAEVIRHSTREIPYSEIRMATLRGVVLDLELNGNGKDSYFFMDPADAGPLKQVLELHLGVRFTG